MRTLITAIGCAIWALPLAAAEPVDRLMQAMRVTEFMQILSEEGHAQGRQINEALLQGSGGTYFQNQVAALYDPDWMTMQLSQSVAEGMTDPQIEQASIFFESELGQTIISLENSARRALTDETVLEVAVLTYEQADRDAPLFRLVDEYVEVNDLVDKNVQGSLSADFQFYRGLASERDGAVDEHGLLEELLMQRDETQEDTKEWIYSFLLLAYHPLEEAQMRENIAFSRTETGKALNDALFKGFDDVINTISYRMGAAAAQAMKASDL